MCFDDIPIAHDCHPVGYLEYFIQMMGDIDHDNDISIIDATIIQRCEANISNYPETDRIDILDESALNGVKYYSDFNRDGERDIVDATCIQRYLVGIPTRFDIGELI